MEIEEQCFASEAYSLSMFLDLFCAPRRGFFVVLQDTYVVGYIIVFPTRRGVHAELVSIAVRSAYRHQGVGQRLLQAAIQWCDKESIPKIQLTVREDNSPATQLYIKNGFRRVRLVPNYYGVGEHGIRMRKE